MAVQDYKINYKSDFVLTINGDASWTTQFCIKFWTGMPSQAYFVGFDGVKYVNCRVGDTPTQLMVMFDDHHLPIGQLKMQIAYHTTIEEFPGSVFDEVTNARDVIVTIDGTDYQVLLDFTGEDAPELEFNLPAYANEAERIQNELQRQQNEADRISAELQREQATAAAVQGAENVNAQLNGTTLTVTNRNGVSTSVNTKGEQGEQGPIGPEGPQGEQGETGISIVSFLPKSETATTLIYTVTFSDGHTQDVAIPKGAKGDTGATGPQGPQGDTGVSITGFVETGETETTTIYNINFSNGTTQQVAIPKGEKGDTGEQGPAGPTGPQGPMGDVAVITPEQQAAFTMYSETGQNTNGPMTQKATTDAIENIAASGVSYDNSQSRLAAENVQAALDEINRKTFVVDEGPLPVQYTEGYCISASGGLTSNSSWKASEFINISAVAAGDTFVWSGISRYLAACIAFYDEDGTLMHAFSATGASRTITIANDDTAIGAAKVRASFLINGAPLLTHNGVDVLSNNKHYSTRGIQDIADELDSLPDTIISETQSHSLNNSEFVQGSNDTSGNITASTKRCITLELYDVDKNTIIEVANNGQAHVMLTYDADGTYRGDTTGWVTADATYTFDAPHKVRFLVSWDGSIDRNIAPSQITAVFTFTTPSKLVEIIDNKIDAKVGKVSISDNDSFCRYNKKIKVYNPYKDHPINQYKGQMHCHTTNSDGALAPAAVVAKYVGYGYDFMTITDHNYITPNPSPNADIVWMGNSYEDTWNSAGHQHMNVWNCSEVINRVNVVTTKNTPSMLVNHYVKNGDSVLSYNHPEYPPVYASDSTLESLPNGISFVEIYNSTIQTLLGTVDSLPITANYGDMVIYNGTRYINQSTKKNSPNWKATTAEANPDGNLDRGFRIMLDSGKKVFCDAVDDFHRGDNMDNRGWQMVFAHSRTKQSIWNGLLMGASYASTGVYLNDVSFIDGVFKLDIADGANAVTTFYGYNNEVLGTANGATAIYEVTGDEKYVRAMVEIEGKKAWTQPVWIVDVSNQYEF